MKNKKIIIGFVNYILIMICLIFAFITQMNFGEFINRLFVLLLSINILLYFILKIFFTNEENKNAVDISIPPDKNEIKDLLKQMSENEDKNSENSSDEFQELDLDKLKND